METGTKSWLAGCGCGCLTAFTLFLATGGAMVGVCYLLWDNDIGGELTAGPAALAWGALAGLAVGGIFGLLVTLVARKLAHKKLTTPEPGP